MGIIHVAEWKGIKVAIKEASAQVILKEVEIYNLMRGYEGVVQFYGVTYPPGLNKLCIVTKYAENGSLSWHLKIAFEKLTWDNKLTLATEIASSVAHLHQEGIYHRDLHGGNILIDGTGRAMLTDFGASMVIEDRRVKTMDEFTTARMRTPEGQSKFVSEMIPCSRTCSELMLVDSRIKEQKLCLHENAVEAGGGCVLLEKSKPEDGGKHDPLIGVMAYIAPERFRKPQHFDARCDIYSLGVLLWELTSGHSAFSKMPQDVQLAVSILNGKREQAVDGTPELYRELYERCWESDPELRPSLDEILSTLEEVRLRLTEDDLAVTRKRNSTHGDTEAGFSESVSVPRPTSDCQKRDYTEMTQAEITVYLRYGIIGLAFLMFVLDCVHIGQLKKTYKIDNKMPWPWSTFLADDHLPNSPPPSEANLHGYYILLLVPDMLAAGMMIWLIVLRRCTDRHYHVLLRGIFFFILVTLLLWEPIADILRIKTYVSQMWGLRSSQDVAIARRSDLIFLGLNAFPNPFAEGPSACEHGGCVATHGLSTMTNRHLLSRAYQWTPPSAGSVYFCFLNHLDVAPDAPYINCGVNRTRNIFAFILAQMVVAEIGLSLMNPDV
ncbi:hypothetical protein EC968_005637 [Mortierella alpina]|nr:hypothetical protein EC968_005637 [Mortierella alpina]